MTTASLKWGTANPEEIKSAPKLSDIKTMCHQSMYFIQVIEECWERAPETKRDDVEAHIKCMRFKLHGLRLQLERKAPHFQVNLADADVKRPPRFKPLPPRDEQPPSDGGADAASGVQAAALEVADTVDQAHCPPAADENDARELAASYIVRLRAKLDLPNRIEAARHDAAVILSRLRASVLRVKHRGEAMRSRIADKMSQYRTNAVSFVQHEMRGRKVWHFLTRFHEPAFDLGTAGARLQPVRIGLEGFSLVLRSWRELAPQIDWDSDLFGALPPEESELATG